MENFILEITFGEIFHFKCIKLLRMCVFYITISLYRENMGAQSEYFGLLDCDCTGQNGKHIYYMRADYHLNYITRL